MNRRGFMGRLLGSPALPFVKPEPVFDASDVTWTEATGSSGVIPPTPGANAKTISTLDATRTLDLYFHGYTTDPQHIADLIREVST